MKELYVEPEMEVVVFDNKDVITTSGLWDEDLGPFVPAP